MQEWDKKPKDKRLSIFLNSEHLLVYNSNMSNNCFIVIIGTYKVVALLYDKTHTNKIQGIFESEIIFKI